MEEKIKKLQKIIQNRSVITNETQEIFTKNGQPAVWTFDIKSIVLTPEVLPLVADIFWEKYKKNYPFQVGGQEVTAIPLVAAIVYKSQLEGNPVNGFFLRKSRKKDGLLNVIEGDLNEHKIILVDDLINSGQTIDRQIKILEEKSSKIPDVFVLVRYRDIDDYQFLKDKNIRLEAIFSLDDFGLTKLKKKNDIPYNYYNVLWTFRGLKADLEYVVPKSTPVLDEKNVYFGSDSGIFWALDQETGKTVWKRKISWFSKKGIFSSPTIWKDKIFFGAYDGNVYCLNKNTGKREWVYLEADWVGSSPAVASDLGLVFIGLEFGLLRKKGGLVALDIKTGEKVWQHTVSEFVHCSPVYSPEKKRVAVGGNDGYVYMFHAQSGKIQWKFKAQGQIKYGLVFDLKRNLLLFGAMNGYLYGLDIETGEEKFKFQSGAGIYSRPVIWKDDVIFSSLDKRVYSLNLETKEINWIFSTSGRIFSSPIIIEGNVFIGSNDGRMYELNAENGALISFFQTTERITNPVCYNKKTKRFFVLTQANEIYCLSRQFSADLFLSGLK